MTGRRNALAIVDEEFRLARDVTRASPTRLLVNLSERCQLRCAHCITDAPAKTQDGSAREMSKEVLEALVPHLDDVSWLGLVHAGEPMLAPQFEPLLNALALSHGDDTLAEVHLLTNGMALTPERWKRVQLLGVTSLSVSMDGMSAATNDVLRIGSSSSLLLERITELVRTRVREVRIGISWVVTSANVHELPELVRFAQRAGVDWIKLEEVFPNNDTARGLVVERYPLDVAVAEARAVGEQLGVFVLDHTRPLTVWRCQLETDERMRRRALLDDFVNRAELNPCRAPWEVACIEPNGDVRPLSFHHPVAGNILTKSLDAIFRDAPPFVAARNTTRMTRLCGGGPTTCAPEPGARL